MYKKIIEKLQNKNIAILGYGKEGKSTYNFIRRHLDIPLTIIDKNSSLLDQNAELKQDKKLSFVLGDNYLDDLEKYDLIIKSAGVSLKDIDITNLKDKLTSQYGLILEDTDFYTIGVTASKGKTTTTTLIYEVLKDQNLDAYLLGNMGNPPLDQIEKMHKDSILVMELAALQLQYVRKSPKIGCIVNLFEEHLDYFGSKEPYFQAKLNIVRFQNKEDHAIYFMDNPTLNEHIKELDIKSHLHSVSLDNKASIYVKENKVLDDLGNTLYVDDGKRKLLGKHNLGNMMFALEIAKILNLDLSKAKKTLDNFEALEHRIEYVGTFKDISFYNDSIATIPAATINCIEALAHVDTLIFGGKDRGIDYEDFAAYLNKSSIRNFICMPDTGNKVGAWLKDKNVYYIEDLKEAVKLAYQITAKGKTCVMSPAASSYNQFKNFEEKGKFYKEYVRELGK